MKINDTIEYVFDLRKQMLHQSVLLVLVSGSPTHLHPFCIQHHSHSSDSSSSRREHLGIFRHPTRSYFPLRDHILPGSHHVCGTSPHDQTKASSQHTGLTFDSPTRKIEIKGCEAIRSNSSFLRSTVDEPIQFYWTSNENGGCSIKMFN